MTLSLVSPYRSDVFLAEDRDALLPLEIGGVHNLLGDVLPGAKGT